MINQTPLSLKPSKTPLQSRSLMLLILTLLISTMVEAQSYEQEVLAFQQKLNSEYKDPSESPLSKKEIRKFDGHEFFPIDKEFRVEAKFVQNTTPLSIEMKTSSSRLSAYDKYGTVTFELEGQAIELTLYQSHRLRVMEKYKDYLFLPFTDLTNGDDSYGGGRYIDLSIPTGEHIIIDFNMAYNPYCAYAAGYSCPIPPAENDIPLRITAGIKTPKH
ncbi:hypothetical protein BFP72_18305 [Reichenbachiella sp. 5M10]|nr:hypothetical protein BFP72_18305 [Reichenbachiella sp. 5M10]